MKLSKLTDYGVVLLSFLAASPDKSKSAASLADETGIPGPTVAKLMKMLARSGLVTSTRGIAGGYALANQADQISVACIIGAIEGPIALTACVEESEDDCSVESTCGVAGNWDSVNAAVKAALQNVKLTDMTPDWRTMFPEPQKEFA
ncbi:MAG: SUF system Fe-S cluster assembly regulator [Planctomycetota bacterium]